MVREGQPLDLLDEQGTEVEHQPLADVGAEQRACKTLQLAQCRDGEQEDDGDSERGGAARADGRRHEPLQPLGERPPAEHRIEHDLEGHRVQERDRARQ